MWHGFAEARGKNYRWFYNPRRSLHVMEQDQINSRAWIIGEPPESSKKAVLKADREAAR